MKAAALPLAGHGVSLEPLEHRHLDELARITDDVIWRYQPVTPGPLPTTPAEHRAWLESWYDKAHVAIANGSEIVFFVRRLSDGAAIGSTRYLAITWPHKRVEIGGTFYAADARGTNINAACKRLLLGRAFDELGCMRVELKCDARNVASARAIAKLGAVAEGTFRQHMLLGDGHRRDTLYFSILDREWPSVRAALDAKLTEK